jgi:hypothetical protein
MPQTVTHVSEAYRFDELTDAAKEKARDWYREGMHEDTFAFDCVTEDFERVCEILGVDLDQRKDGQRRDGTPIYRPTIYWSGFCSQGDGACFEGTYDYKADAVLKIRGYCNDEELIRIAEQLAKLQCENAFGLRAVIKHRDAHYYHSRTMSIEVNDRRNDDRCDDALNLAEHAIGELMVDLADWFYKQLDAQNDYRYSAECVDESITANEYMFDEEGNRHAYA